MTVEPAERQMLPHHVVVAWMASWYTAVGRADWAAGYIGQLTTYAATGAKQGES